MIETCRRDSFFTSQRCFQALGQLYTPLAQRQSARLITWRSHDRNTQGVPYRGGAEEARGTHNPEVIGSNPISGTYFLCRFYRNWSSFAKRRKTQQICIRCGADGKRAEGNAIALPRSLVRFQPPVKLSSWTLNAATFTGVAQRKSAGLITPRSQDQNLSPVLHPLPVLQKLVVKLDIKRSNLHRRGAEVSARGS